MSFYDDIKNFSQRIVTLKDSIQTEEATKMSLIVPFFQLLGYDVFNPAEFCPEYTADVGIKKGEKVDYAIIVNDEPSILIECKWCGDSLDKHGSQLFRYFGTSPAKFGILTNGVLYRFYTDLDESNKMDVLVKQLLELMKLEYGKRKFNDEEFDVVELINEVIRKCNVMLEENQIQVVFDEKKPIYAYADDFYVEQVVTNYFTNAIKHAKEVNGKKQIKITIQNVKNKIRVSVFNTGDKIPEEDLTRVWGRFYKIDDSRNRENSGSGIGLSIVKAIQNNYQNEYGVQNLSNGVEFYFDISTKK